MTKLVSIGLRSARQATRPGCRGVLSGAALLAALLLAGCTGVEWENKRITEEYAQSTRPPGSVYTGWRVFQERCAACHGPEATGTSRGPDLLPVVRAMGARQFVSIVLKRYDWSLPAVQNGMDTAALDALIDDILRRKEGVLTMPAWQGEPRIEAHIVDVYAYLAARAEGTQGPGRPTR
jgi:mono/diheme cytochrome c family protein